MKRILAAALLTVPGLLSAQSPLAQLKAQAARAGGVPVVEPVSVPGVAHPPSQASKGLPICAVEERWAQVPWTKRYHVGAGGGAVLAADAVTAFDTLEEALALASAMRRQGLCRSDPERKPCRVVNAFAQTGRTSFDVEIGGGRVLRGRRLARVASLDEALRTAGLLQAAELCL